MAEEQPDKVYVEATDAVTIPVAQQISEIKTGEWESGLCSCFDVIVPNCCMTCWCPCVSLGQIFARLGLGDYLITVVILLICVLSGFGGILIWFAAWYARSKTRSYFKIPGSCFGDCCCSCCCTCCVVTQMATHIKSYKKGECSFDAPEKLQDLNTV